MTISFGEKMYRLRKEKGISQDALAEQIGTSRQSVSKWENDQGFPEVEKLIMLSSIFNVSIDYLLKNSEASTKIQNEFYVSKEMAKEFILHELQTVKRFSSGIFFSACSLASFLLLQDYFLIAILIGVIFMIIGVSKIFYVCLTDKNYEYKILKQKELIFDEKYLTELKKEYTCLLKKYLIMMTVLPISIIFALACLFVFVGHFHMEIKYVLPICLLLVSIGVYMFLYASTMKETYELLVFNKEYINKFSTRLKNKISRIFK